MSSRDLFSVSGGSPSQKKKTVIPKANFRIDHHGSIVLIVPLCAPARDWLDKNLGKDNGYQPYWPTAIVDRATWLRSSQEFGVKGWWRDEPQKRGAARDQQRQLSRPGFYR
jgi:hypothetical protein